VTIYSIGYALGTNNCTGGGFRKTTGGVSCVAGEDGLLPRQRPQLDIELDRG
jgi:hypothetical protein